ncbi:hypothetical protein [Ideonella sp.]|uniref:hypothetical protein n=1 Tax=Ideonella sp. TaxID=1929293 RepID=UPI002B48C381|nr:hypothetical protein [Ideonella sp.]HJV69712.1 hypothetical protein [Ideonella sp.]
MKSPRSLHHGLLALAALGLSFGAHAATEATKAVVKAIEAKDCAAAVKELNTALASNSPEAWLLGGAMFEHGLCLKPSVERATRLYMRAAEAGRGDGRARLVSLYASPAAGPDKGSALWWAQQAALPLPAACMVPAEARDSADHFAQALGAWPAARLDGCVYVAGVLAALDAEFAMRPDDSTKDGVTVEFQPAAGRVVVSFAQLAQQGNDRRAQFSGGAGLTLETYAHDPSPDQLRAMQTEAGKAALADRVDAVAQAALARFPKPGAVDTAWHIRLRADGPRLQ